MLTRSQGSVLGQGTVGAGRLALRLFLDIQSFDPRLAQNNALNLGPVQQALHDPPAQSNHVHNFIYTGCNYTTTVDGPIFAEQEKDVLVICSTCRLSVLLETRVRPGSYATKHCSPSNSKYPCHHFILDNNSAAKLTDEVLAAKPNSWTNSGSFVCSVDTCSLVVTVTIKPPQITDEFIRLLTDEERMEECLQRAAEEHPERVTELNAPAPYVEALKTLRSYLLNLVGQNRAVPQRNFKFMATLGHKTIPILQKFGYESSSQDLTTSPDLKRKPWFNDVDKRAVYLGIAELEILLYQEDRSQANTQFVVQNAEEHMRRILGCDKRIFGSQFGVETGSSFDDLIDLTDNDTTKRPVDLTQEVEPSWYRGLGASQKHTDHLIKYAFDRQSFKDSFHKPLFFECLHHIARLRESESLQMEVAKMESQGQVTQTQLDEAYEELNVDKQMDEDMIVVMFQSALEADRSREDRLRKAAEIVGRFKDSKKILKASEKAIRDLQHAYSYLDCTENLEDDWVMTSYSVKASESKDPSTVREALKVIAEARKSDKLIRFWKEESGLIEREPPEMSIEEAYAVVGADANTSEDLLLATFRVNGKGNTNQERAFKKIADVRNSLNLRMALGIEAAGSSTGGSRQPDWPVGLENIGNTCYLNSLLQFYYTIKPLRDVVLNFDEYREDVVTEELLERKRIGGRKLSAQEVERAQRFAKRLQTLFENLDTTDQASITPEKELAYLALVSSKDEDNDKKPAETITIAIEPEMPALESPLTDAMEIDSAESTVKDAASVHSEATLIGDELPGKLSAGDNQLEGTAEENIQKLSAILPKHETADRVETADAVASELKEPATQEDLDVAMENASQAENNAIEPLKAPVAPVTESVAVGMPAQTMDMHGDIPIFLHNDDGIIEVDSDYERQSSVKYPKRTPPPIPPRPKAAGPKVDFDTNFMFGRQQDVTECIENVMFQLEAAVKGEAEDENGEQQDFVKKLFYGKCKQYLESVGAETRVKEDYFSHLIVNVADGNKDIYAALDNLFDEEKIELDGKEARRYQTISVLPPILQVQVQRVQFNRETGQAYKSTAQLSFPETIYLDRYLEDPTNSTLNTRRVEAWRWKAELSVLEKRKEELTKPVPEANVSDDDDDRPRKRLKLEPKGLHLSDAFQLGAEYLKGTQETEGVEVDPEVIGALEEDSADLKKELDDINERIKSLQSSLVQQFTDLRKEAYRVQSIFIHRGTATAGHYWIYIYDFHDKKYRKYNDGYVTAVDNEAEVLEGRDGATPYLLVFVKEDQVDELAEAVRRESSKKRKIE